MDEMILNWFKHWCSVNSLYGLEIGKFMLLSFLGLSITEILIKRGKDDV